MSATIIISLSELIAGDARARLQAVLASRATVVVQGDETARLPVVVVHAALEATTATSGFLRFEGLSAHARLALQVVDPDRRFALGDAARSIGQVGDRPYQVSVAADGSLTLVLLKGIGQHHHMNESASYEWLRGLDASAVVIDMSQMEHLNSLLVAWLLQMNQGAGAGRCRLVHVGRQAVTQLSQLRLNHLLVIG
jgi:anti-anti-sigma regulatory factor